MAVIYWIMGNAILKIVLKLLENVPHWDRREVVRMEFKSRDKGEKNNR
jgi:hypothetical protein